MAKGYSDLEKKAAYDQLVDSGVDFDTATDLIQKEAGVLGAVVGFGKRVGSMVGGKAKTFATAAGQDAGKIKGQFNTLRTGTTTLKGERFSTPISSGAKLEGAKDLVRNKAVQAGAAALGTAAVGGAAVGSALSGNREKQACIELLMNEGVDFYTAVELTKQAEENRRNKK